MYKRRAGRQHHGCILEVPTRDSVYFADMWINIKAISRSQNIAYSYVHHVINGVKENPSTRIAIKIASALGLGLEEFLEAVQVRKAQRLREAEETIAHYEGRIAKEDRKKIPTMPGLRLVGD